MGKAAARHRRGRALRRARGRPGWLIVAQEAPLALAAFAGVDRVVMSHGKTYLNAWAGYGVPHGPAGKAEAGEAAAAAPAPAGSVGPAPTTTWSRVSGPGR